MKKENLEVILEQMNSKFDLVLEGHAVLRSEIRELSRKTDERFDMVDFKIDTLNKKIDAVDEKLSMRLDAVAADLSAHRADTEAHHGVYRVMESE
jgi:vacuolar-type H+-ATPase subunit I/STV1